MCQQAANGPRAKYPVCRHGGGFLPSEENFAVPIQAPQAAAYQQAYRVYYQNMKSRQMADKGIDGPLALIGPHWREGVSAVGPERRQELYKH